MKALLALLVGTAAFAASAPGPVTFYKDVLPVLQKNCQGCHRPGEAAPMAFLTYQQTRPWAKAMKEAVAMKRMPPWLADPHYNKFKNDRSLSQPEIDTIVNWADSGALEGSAKDAPQAVTFVDGWNIGKPDAEFEMPNAYDVPASGTIEYQYIIVPTGLTEDKWIQKAEVRAGNRAVVHHVIAFIRPPDSTWMRDQAPGVPFIPRKGERGSSGEFLVGYAPGTLPEVLEPGRAKLMPKGSDIVFQMHYTANGKAATDKSKVGVIFASEPPKERVYTIAASNRRFTIPPGAPSHEVESELEIGADVKLVAMLPHMHLRGKDFQYRAIYPTGEKQVILNVPRYDFNWQLSYYPAIEMPLPKGTRIECTAHFDNSSNNPSNPDATKEVKWGDQSWEEMMIGFMNVAFDAKVPVKSIVAEKKKQGAD